MEITEKEIADAIEKFKKPGIGKRGPFYRKSEKQDFTFDIYNDNLFINAVWQGYLDTSRTCRKINTGLNERKAFKLLAKKIQAYFKDVVKNSSSYDEWHDLCCQGLIDDVKKYHEYQLSYGQAQKVVNMAMKYLYCCEGKDDAKFKYCHLPLDQYTLAWYFLEFGELYLNWSHCSKDKYIKIQEAIRNKLGEKALVYEFAIWEKMQKMIFEF